jgi:hypothetical protein
MTTHFIGRTFSTTNEFGQYETQLINSLLRQINSKFPDSNNLFVNTTWLDQTHFPDGNKIDEFNEYVKTTKVDNLFFFASTDPTTLTAKQIKLMALGAGKPTVYRIGHYDNTPYFWNFFAPICQKHFIKYNNEDLILRNVDYIFINYNRKNRPHRVEFVKKLIDADLMKHGAVTLGLDPDNSDSLHFNLGETPEEYRASGHWLDEPNLHNIPHDLYSLGRFNIWQTHFLNIVSEAIFNPDEDIFVSEKTWKPILGLRPFLINGNPRTYEWLRHRGFKTFNHYFPVDGIENVDTVHEKIIDVIRWLMTVDVIQLYNTMLPDLLYNQNRFYDFAAEEEYRIDNML